MTEPLVAGSCLHCRDKGFVKCSSCDGVGEIVGFLGYNAEPCEPCRGRGRALCPVCDGGPDKQSVLMALYSKDPDVALTPFADEEEVQESKSSVRLRGLGGFLFFGLLTAVFVYSGALLAADELWLTKFFLGILFFPTAWFGLQAITGMTNRDIRKRWPELTPASLIILILLPFLAIGGIAVIVFMIVEYMSIP